MVAAIERARPRRTGSIDGGAAELVNCFEDRPGPKKRKARAERAINARGPKPRSRPSSVFTGED
jgi:hypothetical protein